MSRTIDQLLRDERGLLAQLAAAESTLARLRPLVEQARRCREEARDCGSVGDTATELLLAAALDIGDEPAAPARPEASTEERRVGALHLVGCKCRECVTCVWPAQVMGEPVAAPSEPGQRAYETWAAYLGEASRWAHGEDGYKRAWTAVEQACAVPAEAGQSEAWVSVEERLPEYGVVVLVDGGCAYYDGSRWMSCVCEVRPIQWEVTHWRPMLRLPPPPKTSEGGE